MDASQLISRTKQFALENIRFFQTLPKTDEAKILGKQLLRSATSVASNYRAACRSRSKQEFYSKLCIVVEESDESLFWLELIQDSGILNNKKTTLLMKEAEELLYIFSASKKSTRENLNQ
ncbi:MAG: four helix bundle protein [Bacteroidales bacterium]